MLNLVSWFCGHSLNYISLLLTLAFQNFPDRLIYGVGDDWHDYDHIALLAQAVGSVLGLSHECRCPRHRREKNVVGGSQSDANTSGHGGAYEHTHLRVVLESVYGFLALLGSVSSDELHSFDTSSLKCFDHGSHGRHVLAKDDCLVLGLQGL